mgnify:CR=1 FL=1
MLEFWKNKKQNPDIAEREKTQAQGQDPLVKSRSQARACHHGQAHHEKNRFRLPDRRTALVRWGVLVLTPYLLVPAVVGALLVPTLLEWGFVSPTSMPLHVPDGDLALGIATACALAVAAALVGRRVTLRLIARRRDALVAYLSDPARG